MSQIEIYTKKWCGYCSMAKMLLDKHHIKYQEYDVTSDRAKEMEMMERSGKRTVPQIFIDNQPIGGFTDLAALSMKTDLSKLADET